VSIQARNSELGRWEPGTDPGRDLGHCVKVLARLLSAVYWATLAFYPYVITPLHYFLQCTRYVGKGGGASMLTFQKGGAGP